jgi:subtilisin family serine protease
MPIDLRSNLTQLCRAIAAAGCVLLAAGSSTAAAGKPEAENATGRYIVAYETAGAGAVSGGEVAGETRERERDLGFDARHEYKRALKGFAARLSTSDVAELRSDPEVDSVTPDLPVRALAAQPLSAGETVPTGIARIEAATAAEAHEASSVGVAVIDTGIDLDHPDLAVQDGKNCIGSGSADDDNGHGTHVAGTVGARNQGSGVVGAAPGTTVYAVKVLDAGGSGLWSNIICGIDWVTANADALGIRVANMSLGGLGSDYSDCAGDPLHQAICNSTAAGVVYTAAAGNSGWDWGAPPPDVPAWFPEVLTVTAVADSDGKPGGAGGAPSCRPAEVDDKRASFSSFSRDPDDDGHSVAAPGVCIRSTWPGGGYATLSGTSMAAPHVAGLVALCIDEAGVAGPCAGKTPAQVIQQIRADAQAQTTLANGFVGDPLQPLGTRYYGHIASARATTGLALRVPEVPVSQPPAPAPPPAAAPSRPAPRCTIKRRVVRRHRHHVVRRNRAGKRYRAVRIHRHVRKQRICR